MNTYKNDLTASAKSFVVSSTSGSNEYPSAPWPRSSSAARPIHFRTSTSLLPAPMSAISPSRS